MKKLLKCYPKSVLFHRFIDTLQASTRNFIKRVTLAQVFFCELFFLKQLFIKQIQETTSVPLVSKFRFLANILKALKMLELFVIAKKKDL